MKLRAMRVNGFEILVLAGLLAGSTVATVGEMNMDMAIKFGMVPRATSTNLQTFTGALGGATADPITSSGNSQRPFECAGNTFTDFPSALERSCSNQHNACTKIANTKGAGFTTGQCDKQQTSCVAATEGSGNNVLSTTTSAQQTLVSQDADFLYICDV